MVTASAGSGALWHCSNWMRSGSVTLSLVLYHLCLTLQKLCVFGPWSRAPPSKRDVVRRGQSAVGGDELFWQWVSSTRCQFGRGVSAGAAGEMRRGRRRGWWPHRREADWSFTISE